MGRKQYKAWTPDQSFLFPPSPKDWLPDDHLVYFVLDLIEVLDLSAIEASIHAKDPRGVRPYNPAMMVALLVYAYCTGTYSSRKIARAIHDQVAFRVLTGGQTPHFSRINAFRKEHLAALEGLFQQVLKLCMEAGLVRLGHVALDGTKVQANASKHKANSYKRMKESEARLQGEIDKLLARAEAADAADDERLGAGVDEVDVPAELRRRKDRLARLKAARAALEAEAKAARVMHLRELADGSDARAVAAEHDNEPSLAKLNRTLAAKQRAAADKLDDDNDDEPPFETPGGLPKHRPKTTSKGKPHDKAQRNFTDPDSRIMVSQGAFVQGYNCQAVVDDKAQVIAAADVTNQCPDAGNLVPMLRQTIANAGRSPTALTADAGYWSPEVDGQCKSLGTEAYVSTAQPAPSAPPPEPPDPRTQMTLKVHSEPGKSLYRLRKSTVEPVFGQTKEARGFRRFQLRGLQAVTAEWSFVCTTNNILKLFRAQGLLVTV